MDNAEIWKDIPHYEGLYQVSNKGNVWSVRSNRLMKPSKNRDGYLVVSLHNQFKKQRTERVHRLVALAFIPNPNNLPDINHKNEQRDCNVVENLEWCDKKYNNNYGQHRANQIKSQKKTSVLQYDLEHNLIAEYESFHEASRATGIPFQTISRACHRENNHITCGYEWRIKNA